MASCGRLIRLTASLTLVLLSTFAVPTASLPAIGGEVERRASYWPGMWQFDRSRNSGYGDFYDASDRPSAGKRGYYRPGMWQFDRYPDYSDVAPVKRAFFWPGMWRHQQRRPAKRAYGYGYYSDHPYWLGKACGETGDMEACSMLGGLYY